MWFEVLPSAAIVYACLIIPTYANWALNNIFRKRHSCARNWNIDRHDWNIYQRDRRITGSEYIVKGLESLPD